MKPAVDVHLSEITASKVQTKQSKEPQIWIPQGRPEYLSYKEMHLSLC